MRQVFSRFAIYFDEVGRRGSLRAAAERLRIAPSAIDRQILAMEKDIGVALFERLPTGLRPTAAGELLLEAVRRWRRDLGRVRSQIDDLRGLKRGEVAVALVDGASELLSRALGAFQSRFPDIVFHLTVAGAQTVVDRVMAGDAEIGLTFNPAKRSSLRIERTLVYQLGAVTLSNHPLARRGEITLRDCADDYLIVPDDSMSLRQVIDKTWSKAAEGPLPYAFEVNSVALLKALVRNGLGVGMLTPIDVIEELRAGVLAFTPLADSAIDPSFLSLITASGRTLSAPASLALQHFTQAMLEGAVPNV